MAAETELRIAIKLANLGDITKLEGIIQKAGRGVIDMGTATSSAGAAGAAGLSKTGKAAKDAGEEVEKLGRFSKFTLNVLEAFLLYRGFVFLKMQVQELVGELVKLEHQVRLVNTQIENMGSRPQITSNIIDIGKQTGIAFSELAKTEYQILSANVQLAESFGVLSLSAKAGVAGGLADATIAFNTALTTVNAFERQNLSFAETFDKQFNLIKRGIFTYEQYSRVVGTVNVAFSDLGQDVETTNAALASISQVFTGPQLERGATGLRNAASKMAENRDELAAIGVAVTDAQGNYRNFIDIVEDLEGALAGMNEAARFDALKRIFDDERAVRGIQAILKDTEKLNQFYVEQKFALGDMDEAFEEVNGSIQQQAAILKNNLVPAFDPLVGMLGSTLTAVNALNAAVPGLTSNILLMGTALGAIGVGRLAASSRFFEGRDIARLGVPTLAAVAALRGTTVEDMQKDKVRGVPRAAIVESGLNKEVMFRRTMLGVGLGLGASVLAEEQARRTVEPGFDFVGVGSAAATGGIGGAMMGFGPYGAIIGAAGLGAAAAIGQVLEDEAEPIAKSFAEAFSDALNATSGDVAQSLLLAVVNANEGVGDLRGIEGRLFRTGPSQGLPDITESDVRRSYLFKGIGGVFEQVNRQQSRPEAPTIPGIEEGMRRAFEARDKALEALGPNNEELLPRVMIDALDRIFKTEGATGEDLKTIEQQRSFTQFILDEMENVGDALEAVRIFGDEVEAAQRAVASGRQVEMPDITDLFRIVRQIANQPAPLTGLGPAAGEVSLRLSGDFDRLTARFSTLGDEAEGLTKAFGGLARVVRGVEELRALEQVTVDLGDGRGNVSALEAAGVDLARLGALIVDKLRSELANVSASRPGRGFDTTTALFQSVFGTSAQEASLSLTGLADTLKQASEAVDRGLVPGARYSAAMLGAMGDELKEFNTKVRKLDILEDLRRLAPDEASRARVDAAIESFKKNVTVAGTNFEQVFAHPVLLEDFVNQIADIPTKVVPSATRFGGAIDEAIDLMEEGLLPSLHFSAAELHDLSRTFGEFNKILFKIGIIEELQRLAKVANVAAPNLQTVLNGMVNNISIGGQTFRDLLSDPTRLTDLLSEIEFGDINVDNSQNNNFTIRIDTVRDTDNAAVFAEQIMREINRRTAEARSR